MVTSEEEQVPFSLSMLYVPVCLSLMILIPSRNVYFFGVILIFVGYFLAEQIGTFYSTVKLPGGFMILQISRRLKRPIQWLRNLKSRVIKFIYSEGSVPLSE
jgi:hypothetical protein